MLRDLNAPTLAEAEVPQKVSQNWGESNLDANQNPGFLIAAILHLKSPHWPYVKT